MNATSLFRLAVRLGVVLSLTVIVLGALVRLSGGGPGCPGWPGCGGQLPATIQAVQVEPASHILAERPVEMGKAWKEMGHRYAAGSLGVVALILAVLAWRARREPGQPVVLPLALLGLIVFQTVLGMWTVTLQFQPVVLTAHLMGGFATLILLWLLLLATRAPRLAFAAGRRRADAPVLHRRVLPWGGLAAGVLVLQAALGGWAGTNHPTTDCPDQTGCQQPAGAANDHRAGFSPWRDAGVVSGSGVPEAAAPDATGFTHRIGAVVTLLAVGGLALLLLWRGEVTVRAAAAAVMAFLLIQLSLEISGLVFPLPPPVAVAHNVAAALLLLAVVTLLHVLRQPVTPRLRLEGPLDVTVDTWPPELPGRGLIWHRTPQNKSPDWRGIE